jgi:hypothetical protein
METINLSKIKDSIQWQKLKTSFKADKVYQLKHFDTLCKRMNSSHRLMVQQLPAACYLIPQSNKLIWTVATENIPATVFYVADSSLAKGKKVEVQVQHKFLKKAPSNNVIGYIPGTQVPDSFFVFTAHYDHLGKMGSQAIFPGANDNASGTAFMLALAKYFKENPPKYSIAFIAFSGEEAGLLGSSHYVAHPAFPLSNIKFLVNIDAALIDSFTSISNVSRSIKALVVVLFKASPDNPVCCLIVAIAFPISSKLSPKLFLYISSIVPSKSFISASVAPVDADNPFKDF